MRTNTKTAINNTRLISEVGAYHASEATNFFNKAAEFYNNCQNKEMAQEKAIILFKRAIPHLQVCKTMNYQDHRIKCILNGMKHIMGTHLNEFIPLIKS